MIVTEEEAKTKRCQEAYAAPHNKSSVGGLTVHRGVNADVQIPPVCCIGSNCMAWRWEWSNGRITENSAGEQMGYCGKAGKR